MQAYIFVFSSILLGAVGQVLMKLGATKLNMAAATSFFAKLLTMFTQPYIIAGLFCYGLSAVFWIFGLTRLQLSAAYPMVAAGYVIVFILAVFLFKETVSLVKIGGLLMIIMGVIVLAKS
ncbi:EamA family transporter [Paenibacillus sedimenti]|uniref:Cation/cationic drug transporter n=1 Tax=Paenibacillus sedimenti TaxID=2770274 RepID=A0A926KMT9_9BACL|nr:EamA family transporter [Paenibacillus sedimenti]MBD0378920.1 cation/cationic drug transporter [Paenibacillus sedimenti]